MGAAAAEADRTLFVGNLETKVTEELLFELFHQVSGGRQPFPGVLRPRRSRPNGQPRLCRTSWAAGLSPDRGAGRGAEVKLERCACGAALLSSKTPVHAKVRIGGVGGVLREALTR